MGSDAGSTPAPTAPLNPSGDDEATSSTTPARSRTSSSYGDSMRRGPSGRRERPATSTANSTGSKRSESPRLGSDPQIVHGGRRWQGDAYRLPDVPYRREPSATRHYGEHGETTTSGQSFHCYATYEDLVIDKIKTRVPEAEVRRLRFPGASRTAGSQALGRCPQTQVA